MNYWIARLVGTVIILFFGYVAVNYFKSVWVELLILIVVALLIEAYRSLTRKAFIKEGGEK